MRSASSFFPSVSLAFALALAPQAAAATPADSPVAAALPGNGFPSGWQRDPETWTYPGDRLFEHINGGAEVHLELGFDTSWVQRYREGDREITIEVFEMADVAAATGLFQRRYGRGPRLPGMRFRHTADPYGIQLLAGRCVVEVSGLDGKPEGYTLLGEMARHMASALPAADHASLFDVLELEGRIRGSERVIRGPLSLRDAAPVMDGIDGWLTEGTTAVAALYRADGGTRTVIVADFDDDDDAKRARTALDDQAPGLVTTLVDDNRLTLILEEPEDEAP
ncbi:MAG: hypothetical protein QGH45_03580 [Myxococcota bacterium]|jgi:hypothetical protein|nr:hypothetical protein [Myxococcota bacterium]